MLCIGALPLLALFFIKCGFRVCRRDECRQRPQMHESPLRSTATTATSFHWMESSFFAREIWLMPLKHCQQFIHLPAFFHLEYFHPFCFARARQMREKINFYSIERLPVYIWEAEDVRIATLRVAMRDMWMSHNYSLKCANDVYSKFYWNLSTIQRVDDSVSGNRTISDNRRMLRHRPNTSERKISLQINIQLE